MMVANFAASCPLSITEMYLYTLLVVFVPFGAFEMQLISSTVLTDPSRSLFTNFSVRL